MPEDTTTEPAYEWKVSLRKFGSIWNYFTTNPQGGGFGSSTNSGAPKRRALACALRSVPMGARVLVVTENEGREVSRKVEVKA